jgi:hypothetical protein
VYREAFSGSCDITLKQAAGVALLEHAMPIPARDSYLPLCLGTKNCGLFDKPDAIPWGSETDAVTAHCDDTPSHHRQQRSINHPISAL